MYKTHGLLNGGLPLSAGKMHNTNDCSESGLESFSDSALICGF